MAPSMSLFSVNAVLVLSTDDHSRIFAKYYAPPHQQPGAPQNNPYPTLKDQKAFEKGLLEKTATPKSQSTDVILFDNQIVLFKNESDLNIYVVGSADENEVLLHHVVQALRDSLNILLKNTVDKRTVTENYDLVSLAIDEIVDDGIILETDAVIVASRVSRPPQQDISSMKNIDLSEQGFLNAWEFGKSRIQERLRQGF